MKALRYTLFAAIFAFAAFSFASQASAAGNVHGFAWSDSAGWISMNCDNETVPNGYGIPNSCGTVDYGVTLNMTTGAMTGFAWSTNLGWVRFDQTVTTPTYAGNRIGSARVSGVTQAGIRPTIGWARFCSDFNQSTMPDNCGAGNTTTNTNGGWNGWVSMTNDGSDGLPKYGVTYDTGTGDFDGFAWGGTVSTDGSEVVGWIGFKGVYAIKDPVNYVPVVKLSAVTPIQSGGDTNISYYWTNADADPNHQITACTAFTQYGPVPNWNATSITSGNLPISTLRVQQYVFVYDPSTTYYLDCKNAQGIHAADPSNPGVECNASTPATAAATCPRTTVTTFRPGGSVILTIKGDVGGGQLGLGPVDINLGETVSLAWKSNDPITNCTGYSDQGVFNWKTQATGGTPKAAVTGTIESGVQVAASETNYFMSCVINGSISWSNVVKARIKNPGAGNIILSGRTTGTGAAYVTSPFQVNPGETVDLKWESPDSTTYSNCKAVVAASTEPANWSNGQAKPGISAPNYQQNEIGVLVTPSQTTYQITCDSSRGTVTSNSVVVTVKVPPAETLTLSIKLDGAPDATYSQSTYVPFGQNVTLKWETNASLRPGSCVGSSTPSNSPEYWSVAPLLDPTATQSGLDLNRTVGTVTTYTITCKKMDNTPITAVAYANPLPPVSTNAVLTIAGASCVKNSSIAFDLTWKVDNANGGTVTLVNDGGQADWDGTSSVPPTTKTISGLHITNPTSTIFKLFYTDIDGNAYGPIIHPVTIRSDCNESPRRSWFFRFFER